MRRVLSGAARIVLFMRPAVAIEELDKLKAEAEATNHFVDKPGIESWKARVRAILVGALGATNNIVEKFDNVRYGLSIAWEGMPDSAWDVGQRGQAPHPETRRREAVRARVLGLGSLLLTQLRHRARGDLEMSDGAKVGSRAFPKPVRPEWWHGPMSTLYTKNGRPLHVSGKSVYSRSGEYVGHISGNKIYDPKGRYAATIDGDRAVYRRMDSATISTRTTSARRVGTAAGKAVRSAIWGDEPDFPD